MCTHVRDLVDAKRTRQTCVAREFEDQRDCGSKAGQNRLTTSQHRHPWRAYQRLGNERFYRQHRIRVQESSLSIVSYHGDFWPSVVIRRSPLAILLQHDHVTRVRRRFLRRYAYPPRSSEARTPCASDKRSVRVARSSYNLHKAALKLQNCQTDKGEKLVDCQSTRRCSSWEG